MRRVAVAAALFLAGIYALTIAPGVTFWDAGELIAAVDSLGIPHAPGTPLFVLVARVWSDALWFLPRAAATNWLSLACTATAAGITALTIARATRSPSGSFAAALCAGAGSTVWLNATETEVYAASLLLSWLALCAADRAGRSGEARWIALTAYLLALAVPLHLSALVAAPAAAWLCTERSGGMHWGDGAVVLGVSVLAAGIGTASPILAGIAIVPLAAGVVIQGAGRRRTSIAAVACALIAISAVLFMLIRSVHDPAINSGNPSDWQSLRAVIGREQYGSEGMWPRRAPLWLQLGNLLEYLDWQFALGLAPGVAPNFARTTISAVYLLLGVFGSTQHHRKDRRTWRALLLLWLCGGLGLVVYMNFKAGASLGYGFVPDDAHEARERDYFFASAMWVWGAWAGYGAVALAAQLSLRLVPVGVLVAALPIALNWRAVDRSREPNARLARTVADALLWSAPTGAVLLTAGDNDSFPLWYLQAVEQVRPDVTVVVIPLLGADWYRRELARRGGVLADTNIVRSWHGSDRTVASIANTARASGRPFTVSLTAGGRRVFGGDASWTLRGAVFVSAERAADPWNAELRARIDTAFASEFARRYDSHPGYTVRREESTDPTPSIMRRVLTCPGTALQAARSSQAISLDSTCNFR